MNTQVNAKRIAIFLAFAFGISWAAQVAFYLTIGRDDPLTAGALANLFVVASPALANVATRLITKEGWGRLMLRPNLRRGWRFYLAAWLLPVLAVIVGGAVYYLIFPRSFDPNLSQVRQLPLATLFATVDNPWTLMLYLTGLYLVICVPILGLQGIGEELGWRAYLLPKLVERFAAARHASAADDPARAGGFDAAAAGKAALLVGVIWGVWHWPGLFMFYSGTPILYPLVYALSTCWLSVLLSWVTLRSGSVWPAVFGHAAHNWASTLLMGSLKGPGNMLLGPTPSGLIGSIGYATLALVLLFNRRAFGRAKEAGSEKEPAAVGAQKVQPFA